ncbi:efflux RND transporter periplasmic adaptor subunit [Dendrosporobacter sp. 1207_IL3150]|uniref:efflux RND transporter periplasmic adaptor subunit n=1 Tax=Dendrosporobacter sp. 1207_IL3150 TaxID=3084054 RepID=UPI002FD956D1
MLTGNKKKISLIITVMLVFTGIIGYRIYGNVAANKVRAENMAKNKAVAVQVVQIGRRDINPTMTFSANLDPIWTADISAKVDGRIDVLNVNEGDMVEAGAIVAVLDVNDLQAQVIQAQGNLMAAQSNLEQAELDYSRYASLAEQGAVSAQMLDNARTKRNSSAGQVKAAQGALNLMQEKLNNANVTVPKSGVVTKRFMQTGTFARTGTPLVTVADTTTLLAKATVGESQVANLSVGTDVVVAVDALSGQKFNGVVTRISPMAALPARTFTAEITIPNDKAILKAGMFAKVEIPTKVHAGVLAIPESALVMRDDQKTVFVVGADNVVQQRVLKVGVVEAGWVEILEGVNEGESIAAAGHNKLRDGVQITPSGDGGL